MDILSYNHATIALLFHVGNHEKQNRIQTEKMVMRPPLGIIIIQT